MQDLFHDYGSESAEFEFEEQLRQGLLGYEEGCW